MKTVFENHRSVDFPSKNGIDTDLAVFTQWCIQQRGGGGLGFFADGGQSVNLLQQRFPLAS